MWTQNIQRMAGKNTLSLLKATMLRPTTLYGTCGAASFAKYDRSKPHLNVGTIGKCFLFKFLKIIINQAISITEKPRLLPPSPSIFQKKEPLLSWTTT